MTRPRKTNSRLKQLAETRARATCTIERLEQSISTTQLEIDALTRKIESISTRKMQLEQNIVRLHNDIRAVDKAILREFPYVQPDQIPSTYGFRSEYGKRGEFLNCVRRVLTEAGSEGLTLKDIGAKVCEAFSLSHNTHGDFRRWMKNSLVSALESLRDKRKEVEHIKIAGKHPRWRMKSPTPSWAQLLANEAYAATDIQIP